MFRVPFWEGSRNVVNSQETKNMDNSHLVYLFNFLMACPAESHSFRLSGSPFLNWQWARGRPPRFLLWGSWSTHAKQWAEVLHYACAQASVQDWCDAAQRPFTACPFLFCSFQIMFPINLDILGFLYRHHIVSILGLQAPTPSTHTSKGEVALDLVRGWPLGHVHRDPEAFGTNEGEMLLQVFSRMFTYGCWSKTWFGTFWEWFPTCCSHFSFFAFSRVRWFDLPTYSSLEFECPLTTILPTFRVWSRPNPICLSRLPCLWVRLLAEVMQLRLFVMILLFVSTFQLCSCFSMYVTSLCVVNHAPVFDQRPTIEMPSSA